MSSIKYSFSNNFFLKTLLQDDGKTLLLLIADTESFIYILLLIMFFSLNFQNEFDKLQYQVYI